MESYKETEEELSWQELQDSLEFPALWKEQGIQREIKDAPYLIFRKVRLLKQNVLRANIDVH